MLHILECFFDELEEDMKDQVMDPRKCEGGHIMHTHITHSHMYTIHSNLLCCVSIQGLLLRFLKMSWRRRRRRKRG